MGLDDRLVKDHQRSVKKANEPDPYYEEEADWLMYKEREKTTPLDRNKGIFESVDKKSLNSRPSVFDETAVFHVRK